MASLIARRKKEADQKKETETSNPEIDLVRFLKDLECKEVSDTLSIIGRLQELLKSVDDYSVMNMKTEYRSVNDTAEIGEEDPQIKLKNLTTWLVSHNSMKADDEDWKFQLSPSNSSLLKGIGVYSTTDLPKGKTIMTIQREVILSARFGQGLCPEVASFIESFADNTTLELAMLVLYHKLKIDSFFRPYLEALPTVFSVPLFWDLEIFASLQKSPTLLRAFGNLRASAVLFVRARQTAKKMECRAFPLSYLTWTNFRWALAVVMTRQNKIPLPSDAIEKLKPGEEDWGMAMVPGWDMMNHEVGTTTTVYDASIDALQYSTMHDCPSGGEINMCYGSRPNDLLLIYSGFCVENNPFESLDGDISLPCDSISRVRDCFVKSVGCSQTPVAPSPGELSSAIHRVGNVMFSVNKQEGGILPDAALFGAVAAVMTRDEAGTLMRLRPVTADDLFAGLNRITDAAVTEGVVAVESNKGTTTAVSRKAGDDLRIRAMQYVREEIIKQRNSLQSSFVMAPDSEIEDQKSVGNGAVSHSESTEQIDQSQSTNISTSNNTKRKKKGKKQSNDDDDDAALEEAIALNAHQLRQEQGTTASTGKMNHTSQSDRLPEPFRKAIMASCRTLLQVQHSSQIILTKLFHRNTCRNHDLLVDDELITTSILHLVTNTIVTSLLSFTLLYYCFRVK